MYHAGSSIGGALEDIYSMSLLGTQSFSFTIGDPNSAVDTVALELKIEPLLAAVILLGSAALIITVIRGMR